MNDIVSELLQSLSRDKPLSYGDEKRLAGHEDSRVRRHLAARSNARPEILYYLAEDSDCDVRREIAANESTPHHADILLAGDRNEDVRCDLAQKIGRLTPSLTGDQSNRLAQITLKALEILARDEIVKVRAVLAETLKDIAHAPPHIVRQLAEDNEPAVSGPILRYSPLLNDDDLLDIILSRPVQGALTEISKREGLPEVISDAIVDAGERNAITSLLANDSAQIREETLDRLIDQAPGVREWHEPLARRPRLSPKAARKIAGFVANSLLEVMRSRTDFDPDTLHAVENEFHQRLQADTTGGSHDGNDDPARPEQESRSSQETELARAEKLEQSGRLSEETIQKSVEAGEIDFVLSAIAVKASLALELVHRVFEAKSPKGIAALLQKAQIGSHLARFIQKKTARIPPKDIIDLGNASLDEEEVEWQLGFFKKMLHGRHAGENPEKDQSAGPPNKDKGDGKYDPNWSQDGAADDGLLDDPDWARKPHSPDAENIEPDWAHESPADEAEDLEPDWAKASNGKKDSEPQAVEPNWAKDD